MIDDDLHDFLDELADKAKRTLADIEAIREREIITLDDIERLRKQQVETLESFTERGDER